MASRTLRFPPGFVWGAATSAYQVEGATRAAGKGESIWDRFVKQPGAILHGDTGAQACNSFDPAQLEIDLGLIARLGPGAYIFSIQWPRIQPRGRGRAREAGLDYYRRLVDGLLARGVTPVATLYHWELPQALQDEGGWASRDTVDRFADYAGIVGKALADRVPAWVTQNEPATSSWLGYGEGKHAPGLRGAGNALRAAHHLLLSHGRATRRLRAAAGARPLGIGPVLNLVPLRPASPGVADRRATSRRDGEQNRFFLDALFRGRYPADVRRRHRKATRDFAFVRAGDMAEIATPIDFLGVNYYRSDRVAAGPGGEPEVRPPDGPATAMGWAIDPPALGTLLRELQRSHTGELPLIVSENGASFRDYVDPEGRCRDPERIDFLKRHLQEAHRAVADGVPLKGFFVWSLLDNFEWDSGYRERFGLVHVDYPTQRRTPKASFEWYRQTIRANAVERAR